MSEWIALGVVSGIGLLFFVISYLGYRERVRWYEEYDERNPGVAEQLGVRPRRRRPPHEKG